MYYYYKNRGSARIIMAGGGLLSLLIVVVIMSYMSGESAKTAGDTGQRVKKQAEQAVDDYNRKMSIAMEGSFDVILEDVGNREDAVTKVVRSLKKVGLKDARDIVRSEDGTVLTGMTKAEAENAKRQLEQAGATVKIDKRRN